MNSRLNLTEEEQALVNGRYPNVRMDQLLCLAEGMTSLTYLDLLLSALHYDLDHEGFAGNEEQIALANQIIVKAEYFKSHNGRNCAEGFDPEPLCAKADRLCEMALGSKIDGIYRIDQMINYIRPVKSGIRSQKDLQKIAAYLGARLGELMLQDSLLEKGFEWQFVRKDCNPCVSNETGDLYCDPMAFVYRKLTHDSSLDDLEGMAEDFYSNFLDRIKD